MFFQRVLQQTFSTFSRGALRGAVRGAATASRPLQQRPLQRPMSLAQTLLIGTAAGATVSAALAHSGVRPFARARPVSSEAAPGPGSSVDFVPGTAAVTPVPAPVEQQRRERGLRRVLDYRQLTLGSMAGAAAGYILGRLSKALVAVVVVGVLAAQALRARGIEVPGAAAGAAYLSAAAAERWGPRGEKVDVRAMILQQPGFKAAFMAAFVVAAVYA